MSIYHVSDIMSTKAVRGVEGPPNKGMHQQFALFSTMSGEFFHFTNGINFSTHIDATRKGFKIALLFGGPSPYSST